MYAEARGQMAKTALYNQGELWIYLHHSVIKCNAKININPVSGHLPNPYIAVGLGSIKSEL